jgi:hypothetical protein
MIIYLISRLPTTFHKGSTRRRHTGADALVRPHDVTVKYVLPNGAQICPRWGAISGPNFSTENRMIY